MGEVINLNKFRKRKAKTEASKRADTNRRLHGRNKLERTREDQQKRSLESKLNGAHLRSVPREPTDEA
jgi:Domain of unknown function (DUF4169)